MPGIWIIKTGQIPDIKLISGIWPVFTGHIPDLDLTTFWTSRKGGLGDMIRQIIPRIFKKWLGMGEKTKSMSMGAE